MIDQALANEIRGYIPQHSKHNAVPKSVLESWAGRLDPQPLATLDLRVPLTNANDGRGHSHYRTGRQLDRFKRELMLARCMRDCPVSPDPVVLVITRVMGPRQGFWDADSVLRGNAKELIDALVWANWFVDDGRKYIRDVYGKQDPDNRQRGPSIRVEVFPCCAK